MMVAGRDDRRRGRKLLRATRTTVRGMCCAIRRRDYVVSNKYRGWLRLRGLVLRG